MFKISIILEQKWALNQKCNSCDSLKIAIMAAPFNVKHESQGHWTRFVALFICLSLEYKQVIFNLVLHKMIVLNLDLLHGHSLIRKEWTQYF